MESRNIWNAASHCAQKVNWVGIEDETEWQHIGEGGTFEVARAQKFINEYLPGEMVYIVNGRHESAAIRKSVAADKVAKALKEQSILLCDSSFNAFIEFSYIGVLRCGARNS